MYTAPMSADWIIHCAPFRMRQPAPLTHFEWSVVRNAIASGYNAAGVSSLLPQSIVEIGAIVQAMATQQSCPAWRTTAFGPAPAVNSYPYRCFGAWFAPMDSMSKGRALADIHNKGLLCSQEVPWAGCSAVKQGYGKFGAAQWEGSAQNGDLLPGVEFPDVERCAAMRKRTSYIPMTGAEMLELFRTVGGQLPAQLEAVAALGTQFVQRDFLIGVEMRATPLAQMPPLQTNTNLLALAKAVIEDVAIIWAPGRGESILFLLDQPLDGTKLTGLIGRMMPDLLGEVIPGLPGLLPGLIPPPDDPIWGTIFATIGTAPLQGLGSLTSSRSARSPHTPPNTGSDVVDRVGTTLPREGPPISGGTADVLATLAVAAVIAAGGYLAARLMGRAA